MKIINFKHALNIIFIANLLSFSLFSNAQNSILLHINPLHAADANPASAGIGIEHQFEKLSVGISLLYTYQEFFNSDKDKGDHTGYRFIADIKIPSNNPTVFYNFFPTYWRSDSRNEENRLWDDYMNYKSRIRYGIGAGFVKTFSAYNKINFDLSFGLEINHVIRTADKYNIALNQFETVREMALLPRVRSDFRMRFRL